MEYQFADCVLNTARHDLTRAGVPQKVEPQVFDLLLLLVGNPGRLVSRDENVDVVWGGRIVSESAISARIAAARKAVGDDGKAQAVIRTVARGGLMLVAEVNETVSQTREAAPVAVPAVQRIKYTRDKDGHTLAYSILGTGWDVMRFPPPYTNDLEHEWRFKHHRVFIEALSKHFRYLRYDQVGSGQSERLERDMSIANLADDALCVADTTGASTFAGFALSGGVLGAVSFAARYPERLSRLVIVGGYVDGRVTRGQSGPNDSLKTMIAEGWGKPDSPFATAFLTTYFPEGPLEDVRELANMMQSACTPDTMLNYRDLSNTASIADLLPDVRCPTLVIHGRHDAVHPLSEAQKLAAGIPDAELVVLETANHVPLPGNDVWDVYSDTLIAFLKG
ncbi:alpha/beta fold hydrolase [Tateyamaria pelophila]|uniref:alpha/beta fold hydrolase n=1 Tax=Tateyamaria pelophila TaxID=328415 RepID=UPI001CBC2DE4|nr:alpha/beta fold hydrolase [Tateyamaria pelophila]